MKRHRAPRSSSVAAAVVALLAPGAASAHPLGNFTVNHFAAVDLAGNARLRPLRPRPRRDPDVPGGSGVRAPGYAAALARKLELRIDGRRVPLVVVSHRISERPGAGGLKTLRFDAVFRARGDGHAAHLRRHAPIANRIGWREIVVTRAGRRDGRRELGPGRRAARTSSAPTRRVSCARRSTCARATVDYRPGDVGGAGARDRAAAAPEHAASGFESLIQRGDLSLGVILALAPDRRLLGRGARTHAGSRQGARRRVSRRHQGQAAPRVPARRDGDGHAHGRRLRARARDAAALAVHRPRPALPVADARLGPARRRRRGLRAAAAAAHGRLGRPPPRRRRRTHGDAPSPPPRRSSTTATHHDHHHHHARRRRADARAGILGVGVAAGLLPCPSALVVLLSAIAIHRIGFGFALIAAFSLGLAATITCIGLLAVLRPSRLRPRLARGARRPRAARRSARS